MAGQIVTFEQCFARLLGHEGGFTLDRADRGNWTGGAVGKGDLKGTKYGVSAAAFPGEDISNLTLDRAQHLYKIHYWGPAGCDALPDGVRFDVFDMAVNAGVKRAVRTLQMAVGATQDGILGPRTLLAVQSMPAVRLMARFNGYRLEHLAGLPTWPSFGRGWCKRIAKNLQEA